MVDEINGNGDLILDFLLKTSFVLLDVGAKYDVAKLKSGDFIKKLDESIESINDQFFQ